MKIEFKPKEVYHAQTLKEAEWILKIAHEQGREWSSGASYLQINYWDDYKQKTCYYIYKNIKGVLLDYMNGDYKIIEVSTLMKENNLLPEYWAVMNNGSELFYNVVYNYVEELNGGMKWGKSEGCYYGVFGDSGYPNGANARKELFDEEVVILSIAEFIKLKNNKQIKTKNYEQQNIKGRTIEICRLITTITRGFTVRGNPISGKPSKITIIQRHLTNRAISI